MKPTLLMLLALFSVTEAVAEPTDALRPVSRSFYEKARTFEADGELAQAEMAYRKVYDLEPGWVNVIRDLGRVRVAQGDVPGAIRAYQLAPFDADAVEALGRLYLADGQPELAAPLFFQLRNNRPGTSEFLVFEAAATLQFDVGEALGIFDGYLAKVSADLADPEVQQVALDLINALYKGDEEEDASGLLVKVLARLPDSAPDDEIDRIAYDALRNLSEIREFERQAVEVMSAAGQPLPADQLAELHRARAAFAANQLNEASEILDEILVGNPSNADTWAALSAVREEQGRIAESEQAVVMAHRLAPLNAAYPARLASILATYYGGRFDDLALRWYRVAVRRPGSNARLWFEVARLEQRGSRDGVASVASLERYLAMEPDGEHAGEARRQLEDLRRERPPELPAPAAQDRPRGLSQDAWFSFHLAYVYLKAATETQLAAADRDDKLDTALATVLATLADAPDFVPGVNLKAQIQVERGEIDQAISLWERSLSLDSEQVAVVLDLAQVYGVKGEDPRRQELLARALALGNPETTLKEARRLAASREWRAAHQILEGYFASAPPGTPSYDLAVQLREQVDGEIFKRTASLGGGAAALILAPLVVLGIKRSGVGVARLLDSSPAAYRDVARICSAIRHEVLKHNTTVLGSVADAIDRGDPEPAIWAAEKLYGPRGAVVRFREYIDELTLLGRVHGVSLNLRRRDPLFGPIIEAVDRLARLERDLRGSPGTATATQLRDISKILNETGYRGLGALVQRVCLLELTEGLLRQIYEEVRHEPAFDEALDIVLTVSVPAERILLRIFRTDLEDILTNLLRNGLAACVEVGAERIGILVTEEWDDITGLERVAIRVVDDAPRRISTAMIRGRYISRGLGLAVDLISRNAGSIHVEDEKDWSKAVVVRLPRAEADDEE